MTNGVPHISASQINRFLAEPALWIVEQLYQVKGSAGPGAWRGSACESAMDAILFDDGDVTDIDALQIAESRFEQDAQGDLADDVAKARAELPLYLANLLPFARKLRAEKGRPLVRQSRIELNLSDIKPIIIGYVDYLWDDIGLDLKTVGRMPSFDEATGRIKDKSDHIRQMSIYARAKGKPFSLAYVTPGKKKEPILYQVTDDENTRAMRQVIAAAKAMNRLLANADDRDRLAMMYPPRDIDGFMWSPETREKAIQLWSL